MANRGNVNPVSDSLLSSLFFGFELSIAEIIPEVFKLRI